MLKDRNLTSHTYKEDLALEIYHRLPAHFCGNDGLIYIVEYSLHSAVITTNDLCFGMKRTRVNNSDFLL